VKEGRGRKKEISRDNKCSAIPATSNAVWVRVSPKTILEWVP